MTRRTVYAFAFLLMLPAVLYAAVPELPRILIDTTYRTPSGTTTPVNSGGNLQTAINSAACGDVLSLEAGATFTGNFTLPDKDCAAGNYVVIRTATPDGTFPRPGNRVGPSHASLMAKLTAASGSGGIVVTASDADHYRLIGLEITPTNAFTGALVDLSGGEGNLATQTNNIIIDRCYIHGHATGGAQRGISAQGAYISLIDSYVTDIKLASEANAFAAWNGSGPFKLYNNYIAGAGQSILFGGAAGAGVDFLPSDIEIRRNHLSKSLAWKADDPSYEGINWANKTILELKAARRVLIENNLIEQCWVDSQNGTPVLFTVRGEVGSYAVIEDVTFRGNWVRKAAAGFNILGVDDGLPSGQLARLSITHSLLSHIDQVNWTGGDNRLTTSFSGPDDVTLVHNTLLHNDADSNGAIMFADTGPAATGYVFQYNLTQHNATGFSGTGLTCHTIFSTETYFVGEVVSDNVIQGAVAWGCDGTDYPGNTLIVANTDFGFENYAGDDFRLDTTSAYDGIGDAGSDIGAWIPVATAAASQIDWNLEWRNGYTAVAVTFGAPGLPYNQSCDVRVGSAVTTSSTGPSRRTVVVTGLTPATVNFIGVDCGTTWGGAVSYTNFTAAAVPGGNRTVPISIGDPANASVTRCTVDYDDNPDLTTPTSAQDTTCGSGGEVEMTVPAGITYWRVRLQDSGDNVLATGTVQPLSVD